MEGLHVADEFQSTAILYSNRAAHYVAGVGSDMGDHSWLLRIGTAFYGKLVAEGNAESVANSQKYTGIIY